MSSVNEMLEALLAKVDRLLSLRDAPELGFSTGGSEVVSLFVNQPNHPRVEEGAFFYTRDERARENVAIRENQLTCVVENVYKRLKEDKVQAKPVLELHLRADKRYILQTGFSNHFASTLLAALVKLPPGALREPITIEAEHYHGTRSYPIAYAQVIYRGEVVERRGDKALNDAHLSKLQQMYGFANKVMLDEAEDAPGFKHYIEDIDDVERVLEHLSRGD